MKKESYSEISELGLKSNISDNASINVVDEIKMW